MMNIFGALLLAILSVSHCVLAVLSDDAFKSDWIVHNYGNLSNCTLLGHRTALAKSDDSYLYYIDMPTKEVTASINLSLFNSNSYYVTDNLIITFSTKGSSLYLFERSSGVYISTINLNSPVVQISEYQQNKLIILEEKGVLYIWNGEVLSSMGSFPTSYFSHYSTPNATYIFLDSSAYVLNNEVNSGIEVFTLSPLSSPYLNSVLPENYRSQVVREHNFPRFLDQKYSVVYVGNVLIVLQNSDSSSSVVYKKAFKNIAQFIVHDSYIALVSRSKVYFVNFTEFLKIGSNSSIAFDSFDIHDSNGSFSLINGHFSVQTDSNSSFIVEDYDIATGKQTIYSISKNTPTGNGLAIIVDRPPSLSEVEKIHNLVEESQSLSLLLSWSSRVKRHLVTLGKFVSGYAVNEESSPIPSDNDFGINKIIVFLDHIQSKICARETKNGDLLWCSSISPVADVIDLVSENEDVFVISSSHMLVFSLITGELLKTENFKIPIDNSYQVLCENPNKDFTEDDEVKSLALKIGNNLQMVNPNASLLPSQYLLSHDRNTVSAFKIVGDSLQQTWKWSKSDQEIVLVSKNSDSLTSAGGIGRSDRSVLYKYLNPNLVVIFSKKSETLNMYVLDGVSGELMYVQEHKDETLDWSSINVVQNDNWIIYTLFVSFPKREQRVYVLDLFQDAKDDPKFAKSSFVSSQITFSSKAFIYPERIISAKSTDSKYGITTKSIIFLTEHGSLVEVPKYVLNSRRIDNRKLTPKDMSDDFKISAYEPIITEQPLHIINHKHELRLSEHGQSLLVLPTNLESTAVVCFINEFNEFCSTVQPSLSYDMLKTGFDRKKLLFTLVLLVILLLVSKPFVHSKKLNSKWTD